MITMADLERKYVVPLRKEWLKTPKYRRSKKAVTALKSFLLKHMKGVDVKVGKNLNEFIWKHGIKNPPHKVKVNAVKGEDNIILVELEGFKYEAKKKEEKKAGVGGAVDKLKEKLGAGKTDKEKKVEAKREETVEKKAEEGKKVEKEEIKEMKKEEKEVPKEAVKTEKKEAEKDAAQKAPRSAQGINRNQESVKADKK